MNNVQNLPFVSIIMPVRNEADFIEQALQSILDSDYPAGKLEVLVVDGDSSDDTRRIAGKSAETDTRIKILDNPRRIVPTAMNIALKQMRGDVFIRIDGHAKIPADFISKSIQCLNEHPDAWVVVDVSRLWRQTLSVGRLPRRCARRSAWETPASGSVTTKAGSIRLHSGHTISG